MPDRDQGVRKKDFTRFREQKEMSMRSESPKGSLIKQ